MRLFYSDTQAKHDPRYSLEHGKFEEYYDSPERAYAIVDAVVKSGLGTFERPFKNSDHEIEAAHGKDKINFLKNNNLDIIVSREKLPDIILESDEALSLSEGTYEAARSSVSCALSGAYALYVGEEDLVYALCRPPGHHATRQKAGGYCFFNNAAIAAKYMRDRGAKLAILDIDVHHGNGTQEIVYDEPYIVFASLNGTHIYPHERNKIADEKQNPYLNNSKIFNIPVEPSTDDLRYLQLIDAAIDRIKPEAEAIVVSAGFDTSIRERKDLFKDGPNAGDWEKFGLTEDCYYKIGQKIRKTGLPILAVQEGGYNVNYLGQDVTAFLSGLAGK